MHNNLNVYVRQNNIREQEQIDLFLTTVKKRGFFPKHST